MKIAFIRPSMFGTPSKDAMMPLIFAIIKPLTIDAQIIFYDEKNKKLPDYLSADVVAMTVDTFSAKRAYVLAEKYKKENKTVIMGGFHPTMMPDECLAYADAVIIGEAEDTWPEVIKDLKNNKLKKKYISSNNIDMATIKYDYTAFIGEKYNGIGLVQFSRGCKFSCDFCSIHAFYKSTVRTRTVENVIDDVKNMKEEYIFFIDDNLFADDKRAIELFQALAFSNKKWVCQISIDVAKNEEILKMMKKGGCILVLIGFESLNVENLKQMRKGANILYSDYEKAIKNIYSAGLMIYGTFVIGYDEDTAKSTKELVEFAVKHKFAIANFNPLMPMPGTSLYERLKKEENLAYDKWWINEHYKYGDSMVIPKKMTGYDLMECCKNARYSFYSYKSISKRMFCKRNMANASVFLKTNLISRFEIMAKQGRKLGESN